MIDISDFKTTMEEMKKLYLNDDRPWIIGLSGGKDSTCVTQLAYNLLLDLPKDKRTKQVHVLSANTLVESPYVLSRIENTCKKIETKAKKDKIPLSVKILRPELNDTFWVNLIGRGYPSPNRWFRWCTDRLKIKPMTKYIHEQVKENGEVVILLGARKEESASRAQTMGKYEIKDFRLRKHATIPGAYIYTPIEDWNTNEVWAYLIQSKNPWGESANKLRAMYRKLDKECPLVIDKSTPACGQSRFGCWTCTVVERDRALEGLIEDGETWMEPLLEFRNWLKEIRNKPEYREKVRKNERRKKMISEYFNQDYNGQEHRGHKVLGPFTFETRHEILKRLIKLQEEVKNNNLTLISPEEIKAIETLWIYEGDSISSLADVLGTESDNIKENGMKNEQLESICEKHGVPNELVGRLLIVENDFSRLSRRVGIYNRLEKVLSEHILYEMSKGNGVKK